MPINWDQMVIDTTSLVPSVRRVVDKWIIEHQGWNSFLVFENFPPRISLVLDPGYEGKTFESDLSKAGELATSICFTFGLTGQSWQKRNSSHINYTFKLRRDRYQT